MGKDLVREGKMFKATEAVILLETGRLRKNKVLQIKNGAKKNSVKTNTIPLIQSFS